MELWKQILQILDTQMETPVPYGPFHLLWLAITLVASLLLGLYSRTLQKKTVNRIVLIISLVCIAAAVLLLVLVFQGRFQRQITEKLEQAAAKVVGTENISEQVRGMGGEDFAFISRVKPSMQFMLGVKTPGTEKAYPVHNGRFNPDEGSMAVGIEVFLQFVLDNMHGIDLKEVKL